MEQWLSVAEAADRLGMSPQRVRVLLTREPRRLVGRRVGRSWQVDAASVQGYRAAPSGRQRRQPTDGGAQLLDQLRDRAAVTGPQTGAAAGGAQPVRAGGAPVPSAPGRRLAGEVGCSRCARLELEVQALREVLRLQAQAMAVLAGIDMDNESG